MAYTSAILLALLTEGATAGRIMKDAGITEKDLRAAIQDLRQSLITSAFRLFLCRHFGYINNFNKKFCKNAMLEHTLFI